ncbi:MAG: hypothetical protein J4F34_03200 [Gemmatimonadetes bacterium]|nr:hypothetical protein [Gemmatimonadota bacterium]
MSLLPLRPLRFGEIVDGALQLYRRDFGLYYLIALLGAFPGYVVTLASGVDPFGATLDETVEPAALLGETGLLFGVLAIDAVISWLGMLAVAVAMVLRIDEQGVSVGGAYRRALGHLPAAGGATLLALLLFVVVGFVVFAVATVPMAITAESQGIVLALLGFLFLFLPVIVCMVCFWLAATFAIFPAVIIEDRGVIGALRRSLHLCRGGWLRVIGIMIVAMIINIAPSFAIAVLFGFQELFTSPEALETIDPGRQWLLNTADLLAGPLTAPFLVGAILILFHDRRVRSEAYDLEARASAMETG